MSTPKALLRALQNQVHQSQLSVDFQAFKGIYNIDDKNHKARYCYVISFLQLLLHSQNVLQYFRSSQIKNKNEILLLNIFKDYYADNNDNAIKIDDFLNNWRCWNRNRKIPNEQCDTMEFGQYLFNSLSANFTDLFRLDIDCPVDDAFILNDQFTKTYFLQLPLSNVSIQNLIDDKLKLCTSINKLPKCLFLYLLRQDTDQFIRQCISINTFITISNHFYKFVGMTTLHVMNPSFSKNTKKRRVIQ